MVQTCGQCHEGSHRRFAGYLTHATHHDPEKYPWLFWSFWGMTLLLVGTLTFALLHTLAWLLRLYLSRDEWRAHKELSKVNSHKKLYRRFNRLQRGMHLAMLLSFFTLALTGMILKFSYMGWAQGIAWALGRLRDHGRAAPLRRRDPVRHLLRPPLGRLQAQAARRQDPARR